ncbi:MAG: branched-chain amino acid ABC transporter permease [Candidatus Methylomirabilales bacterium]
MRWGWLALGVVLLVAPLTFQDPFYERMMALVLLWAVLASAWNIVGGYAGQVSFGHAMFFGVGAYLPLLVYTHWGGVPLLGIPVGMAVSAGIAILIGMPTFRLHGHYLSMATIAIAELIRLLVTNWEFVGAARGLGGPASGRTIWDLSYRSSIPYYYIFLVVLASVLAFTYHMEQSRMGYYLRAIKAGQRAARSLGVSAPRYKLYALIVSAAFTSLAGSLYAVMLGFVDPDSVFGILVSVQMVIMAALGGTGTLIGPLVGAALLIPLQTFANSLFGGQGNGLTFILYGGIIILLSRFEPGGLLEIWNHYLAQKSRVGRTE